MSKVSDKSPVQAPIVAHSLYHPAHLVLLHDVVVTGDELQVPWDITFPVQDPVNVVGR